TVHLEIATQLINLRTASRSEIDLGINGIHLLTREEAFDTAEESKEWTPEFPAGPDQTGLSASVVAFSKVFFMFLIFPRILSLRPYFNRKF
ncbi:hypothetical protein FRC03_011593, partial [Tulasnella sp. 419]